MLKSPLGVGMTTLPVGVREKESITPGGHWDGCVRPSGRFYGTIPKVLWHFDTVGIEIPRLSAESSETPTIFPAVANINEASHYCGSIETPDPIYQTIGLHVDAPRGRSADARWDLMAV